MEENQWSVTETRQSTGWTALSRLAKGRTVMSAGYKAAAHSLQA